MQGQWNLMEYFYNNFIKNQDQQLIWLSKHAFVHLTLILLAFLAFFVSCKFLFLHTPHGKDLCANVTAVFLGVLTAAIFHEWSHLIGAKIGRSAYTIPRKSGVFIFEWNFAQNSVGKFYIMSVSGSIGGLLSVLVLSKALPDTGMAYNNTVLISAFSAFVFGAAIEWPVLYRTISSKDPYAELEKTTPKVLIFSLLIAIFFGTIATSILAATFN